MNELIREILTTNATKYETAEFLQGDPSWFMHQVEGRANREAMAFTASCLSYGSRKQFMPKIESLRQLFEGGMDAWIREGRFRNVFPDDNRCFYRLYTNHVMFQYFAAYQQLMSEYNTLGEYVRRHAKTGLEAVECICSYFSKQGLSVIIPKDATSSCKRVCMFLRWMVRTDSPVDLGIWSDFIDKRTLIMPLDTHVLQQSVALGLLTSRTTTMSTAIRLTNKLAEVFPDDPLRGDFALFGYGVTHET